MFLVLYILVRRSPSSCDISGLTYQGLIQLDITIDAATLPPVSSDAGELSQHFPLLRQVFLELFHDKVEKL